MKLGKKINFTVDIGFAIYCLEIMKEAPVGIFASEDKKGMIFKGTVIVRAMRFRKFLLIWVKLN